MKSFFKDNKYWVKVFVTLLLIFIVSQIVPDKTLDPWEVFNPKKVIDLLLALSIIQVVGHAIVISIGSRESFFVTGFMGGIVSSTATTLDLCKRTKNSTPSRTMNESVIYLSSTLAMLLEGILFLFIGVKKFNFHFLAIFLAPIVVTLIFVTFWIKKSTHKPKQVPSEFKLDLISSLKLILFILIIITISKAVQKSVGQSAMMALTFIVSLFEVHGSIIANIELFQSKTIKALELGQLIAISLIASYVSKIGIVLAMGNKHLKKQVIIWSSSMILSIGIGLWIFSLWIS